MIESNNELKEISKIIKKETIQRLLKDIKQIIKHPLTDNGIFYSHDETDMLKGYAMIIGPEGTPYFGGYYFFKFNFPTDYPYSPHRRYGIL
jgi:ubiquitin-protein ligase